MKRLERENERLLLKMAFLKKLEELERRKLRVRYVYKYITNQELHEKEKYSITLL